MPRHCASRAFFTLTAEPKLGLLTTVASCPSRLLQEVLSKAAAERKAREEIRLKQKAAIVIQARSTCCSSAGKSCRQHAIKPHILAPFLR